MGEKGHQAERKKKEKRQLKSAKGMAQIRRGVKLTFIPAFSTLSCQGYSSDPERLEKRKEVVENGR